MGGCGGIVAPDPAARSEVCEMVYALRNMAVARFTAATKRCTSSIVLYIANEALTVPSIPSEAMSGWAQ